MEQKIQIMLEQQAMRYACTVDEVKKLLIDEYGPGADRGYLIGCDFDVDFECITRIEELGVYEDHISAAIQAEKDGIQLIPSELTPHSSKYSRYRFIDTPETRKAFDYFCKLEQRISIDKVQAFLEPTTEQTPERCMEAVHMNGMSLQFIGEQTEDICLAAVKENGCALQYVKNQTTDICLAAVREHAYALKYVREQTPEICLAAAQTHGAYALEFVKEQTDEICMAAVQSYGCSLKYVHNKTPEICLAAVKEDYWALDCITSKDPQLWAQAMLICDKLEDYQRENAWASVDPDIYDDVLALYEEQHKLMNPETDIAR